MRKTIAGLGVFGILACLGCSSARPEPHRSIATGEESAASLAPDPDFLRQYAETNRFRAGKPTAIKVAPGGRSVLYLRSGPRDFVQNLYELDLTTGEERLALTAEALLGGGEEHLSAEELARRERQRLASRGITSYSMSEDGDRLLIPLSGRLFVVSRSDWTVRELRSEAEYPLDARFSKDGSRIACVRDGELFVIDVESGAERQLTREDSSAVTNGLAEFIAQEEMDRDEGYWWSPNGEMIAYERVDTTGMEEFAIADAYDPAKPAQVWPYPRAGKRNADTRLGLIPSSGGSTNWVEWDRETYPYLATVKWPEHGPLTIVVQNRRQTEHRVLEVDVATGATRTLLVERDPAWINLFQSTPRWLKDGSGFLWLTERNGHTELELRARDGALLRTLAGADIGLADLIAVDARRRVVYVTGSSHPIEKHVWRVPLDGGRPTRLTTEPGVHSLTLAEDGSVLVETSHTASGRESWIVRDADGRQLATIRSVAESTPRPPRIEYVTVNAGGRDLHAAMIRPHNARPGQRYPVIASVYGGPHSQVVTAARNTYRLQQWIADHGYIVVSIDGRGTPARGRDWERAIKGNLIDLALEDLVAGLHALGRRYRELDLDRVGIFGWSFGGYFSAMATMRHPELFKAGVAGAPVCDWRDYDTHYTERYVGLPHEDTEAYDVSNVLTYCAQLERPLLIIHGTADDNVYLVHSLKMADALLRAGKSFEFLPLAGATHMVREPEMVARMYARIMEFFDRHLAR